MTTLREAAQAALEALESLFSGLVDDTRPERCSDAIVALRAALAQPDQMDELRRACAEILGADPETWPEHGNAPLAIAASLQLAVKASAALAQPDQPVSVEPVATIHDDGGWTHRAGRDPFDRFGPNRGACRLDVYTRDAIEQACAEKRERLRKLSAALSRISYVCSEPNEMGCGPYDVHCDEDAVVVQVEQLRAEIKALRELWEEAEAENDILRGYRA